jgi:hypothetical protein
LDVSHCQKTALAIRFDRASLEKRGRAGNAAQVRQVGEENTGNAPALGATVGSGEKFQSFGKKITRMAVMRNAALHNRWESPTYSLGRNQPGDWTMGFFTELFARPRPKHESRYRAALALLDGMSASDRADIGIKPADFPRIAREMAIRN